MKYFRIILLFVCIMLICFALLSCEDADIIVRTDLSSARITETSEETSEMTETDEDGMITVIINKSSGVFHISEDCYSAKLIKDENRIVAKYKSISDVIADGYRPCGSCAKKYTTENENG